MRGVNIPHKPILAALLLGTVLVAFALIKGQQPSAQQTDGQLTVVTEAPERTFLQPEDSNENGIPDWQEALVRTEVLAASLPSASSSNWKPQSLTDSFTVAFIEGYLRNKTYGQLGRSQEDFASLSADMLGEKMLDKPIGQQEIMIDSRTDTEALRAYGNGIMAIMNKYPAPPENEVTIIDNALRANNPQALEKLDPILNAYRGMVVDMKLIPVPSTYVAEHLALINTYQGVANDIEAMRSTFTDPALAMVRMKRYKSDVTAMAEAIMALVNKLVKVDKVRFAKEDPLYPLIPSDI